MRMFRRLPIARKLLVIVGVFVAIVICVFFLGVLRSEILSGVRAYVGGPVIGDGGDFVSFAGKYIEPARPGGWLDPGPFGCLGTGLGYAIAARIARPSAQIVLLLGDGAAGFSLMDADTLVRHRLPVVIVCGNNGGWGLEKHPMRALYGYDVAADLQPGCRYDEVVRALGGAGELVTTPAGIAPAPRPPAVWGPAWAGGRSRRRHASPRTRPAQLRETFPRICQTIRRNTLMIFCL